MRKRYKIDPFVQKKIFRNLEYIVFELNTNLKQLLNEFGIFKTHTIMYKRCIALLPQELLIKIANKYNFDVSIFYLDSFEELYEQVEIIKLKLSQEKK